MNSKIETEKIISFLQNILKRTGLKDIVLGWSGGIDSTLCLFLLVRAMPNENIHVLHLPYIYSSINELTNSDINGLKVHEINIKKSVDTLWKTVNPSDSVGENGKVRLGNIMARVRMITLFDFAKKVNGLVCGTENKSEHLLGYFTRYGDGASDIEPIQHLFKTQVFELAKYLGVPDTIIKKSPSANLWDGQTDEGEFGFTYEEADEVLSELREYKGIVKEYKGKVREKIMERVKKNKFKREVPYTL
ncbi:NAD+ synthase [Candidatus Roizmanbacteria bacterium]|nr:NAD+ synthase [Candidatus Roizmanbacteria bacterium]